MCIGTQTLEAYKGGCMGIVLLIMMLLGQRLYGSAECKLLVQKSALSQKASDLFTFYYVRAILASGYTADLLDSAGRNAKDEAISYFSFNQIRRYNSLLWVRESKAIQELAAGLDHETIEAFNERVAKLKGDYTTMYAYELAAWIEKHFTAPERRLITENLTDEIAKNAHKVTCCCGLLQSDGLCPSCTPRNRGIGCLTGCCVVTTAIVLFVMSYLPSLS